jgi:penicillin G amidase
VSARLRRRLVGVALGIPLFGLLSATLGWLWLRRSLPELSGSLEVPTIEAPLEIVRDRDAIPHVFAASEADAYFGLGFAHGQDRSWQLELMRRAGSGRLAEVFGEPALGEDRLMRAVGLRRAAERSLEGLDAASRLALERYAAGVNAARAATPVLPLEFIALGVEPEPWTPLDSLVAIKLLAWQLSIQLGRELLRATLAERLAPAQLAELLGGDAAALTARSVLFGALSPALDELRALGRDAPHAPSAHASPSLGSNGWAVSGAHTPSGKPLLANDPHLGLSMPALWYLAHLSAPGLNVIGATIPGLPGVILGRNERVAWGFTNNRADTQDLYLERLDPSDPSRYLTPAGSAPFERVEEVIRIKGAPAQALSVRITRHGPVISDVDAVARAAMPEGHVLALRYAALLPDDLSIQFPLSVAHATDVQGVLHAAQGFFSPPQNILAADAGGGLALVAAGRVPLRSPNVAARGLLPLPGWLAEYDWQGFVPFAELPRSGASVDRLVTANQDPTPPGYPHWLGGDWAAPARAERIQHELERQTQHSAASFAALQMDEHSAGAARLVAAYWPHPPGPGASAALADAIRRLQAWDFVMRPDAPEPLLYAEWSSELLRAVFSDELGDRFGDVAFEAGERLMERLVDTESRWCDDVGTATRESCASQAEAALERAVSTLRQRYGDDPADWRWGTAHPVRFSHTPLGLLPVIGAWFDTLLPSGGGNDTVNLAEYSGADAEQTWTGSYGPSYRAIYDLGSAQGSSFIVGVGQSGNPLSKYYRHFAERWQHGQRVAMRTEREQILGDALGTLKLLPVAR